jgi:2,4-dienoyl-CoA reductase-like NADH-dependent reductase (Old Yellow Enzyme family)
MALLSDPLLVGDLKLRNRVVMSPLTRCRAPGRVPTLLMAEYYRQRASAGLIIAEATAVTPMGVGYPDTPGIWSKEQVEAWKPVTKAVHEAGGTIVLQLWHVGRISDPSLLGGAQPVAPSAIAAEGHVNLLRPMRPFTVPRALETSELPAIVENYRVGAASAMEAGFDGVDVHAANGYLLNQFLDDCSNRRTDEYGGSVENRARLLLEVVDAATSSCGKGRVGVHLSPRARRHSMGDSDPKKTFGYVARELGKRGVAFLFIRDPFDGGERLTLLLKREFGGAVIANDKLTPEQGEALVAGGEADAAAWGELFIANPDLPKRLFIHAPLNAPDPSTYYGNNGEGVRGYTDYPFLGRGSGQRPVIR